MGCIPMRKPLSLSNKREESNTNINNLSKKSNPSTPIPKSSSKLIPNPSRTSDNYTNLNTITFPKLKPSSVEHSYKIIQKINSLIHNAYKVLHRTTSLTYTMITLFKSSIENEHEFKTNFDKVCKIKHKNLITVYELYEDSYYYYIICEYFDGNKLYDECSIELAKYNEYALSKILKKIMKAIQTLKRNGITDYYVDPQNVFCNFTFKKNKIIVKVFYNQFFTGKTNYMCDTVKHVFNPLTLSKNKEEWSLGVLMYSMLFGSITAYIDNAFAEQKVFVQITNSLISKHCKELLLSLLQVRNGNGMSCEIGLCCEFIAKANVTCLQKLEGKLIKGVKRFFMENCFYYKALLFCEDYIHMNDSIRIDKMYNESITNSNTNSNVIYSLYKLKHEKMKNEEQDVELDMNVFLNDIRLFRIRQQIHQLRRIYSKIDNNKDNVVLILSLSEHDIFKEVIKVIQANNGNNNDHSNNNKISFDLFFKTLYDKLNTFISNDTTNYLINIIGKFQSIDTKNFNKEFLIIANKWYSSEDCFDVESLINDHCSSSDICSSECDNDNNNNNNNGNDIGSPHNNINNNNNNE